MVFITNSTITLLICATLNSIMMSSGKSPAAIPFSLHSLSFPVVEHGMPWLDMDVITVVVILRIGDYKCECRTQMRQLRHYCRYVLRY
jgi:hypothetical protein